jgi:hypothetical protein
VSASWWWNPDTPTRTNLRTVSHESKQNTHTHTQNNKKNSRRGAGVRPGLMLSRDNATHPTVHPFRPVPSSRHQTPLSLPLSSIISLISSLFLLCRRHTPTHRTRNPSSYHLPASRVYFPSDHFLWHLGFFKKSLWFIVGKVGRSLEAGWRASKRWEAGRLRARRILLAEGATRYHRRTSFPALILI